MTGSNKCSCSSRTWARSPSYLYSQTNSELPNRCITSWIPFVGWASIGFSGMPWHTATHHKYYSSNILLIHSENSTITHTHTHPFNGPFSGTTRVSRYQKSKTNLDFTEARDSEWQWHLLGHMQVCSSLQTDNHASTSPLSFYRPDALPAAQPTASKH